MNPHIKEMVEGPGYKIVKVDYARVHRENKDVDIDSVQEAQAVLKAHVVKILSMKDSPLVPIFECAELNNRGHPIDARYAFQIGKKTNRMQAVIQRPLMPNSNRTLVDDSTESRLWRLAIGIVNTVLNNGGDYKYVVQALSLLMSVEFCREQMRHHDLEAYYDEELKKKAGISIVIPIDYKAALALWPESQKYVQAAKKVEANGTADYSIMSEFRELVGGNAKEIKKVIEHFGEDEMMMVLDNTVHAGAKNDSNRAVFRLHIYATIEGTQANTADTNVPTSIVWDLTRSGAESEDFYSTMVKVLDESVYKGEQFLKNTASQASKQPTKAPAKPAAESAKPTKPAQAPQRQSLHNMPSEPPKSPREAPKSPRETDLSQRKSTRQPVKSSRFASSAASDSEELSEPPKKRPVGRPRKHPVA